jgi:hypothetical protein
MRGDLQTGIALRLNAKLKQTPLAQVPVLYQ